MSNRAAVTNSGADTKHSAVDPAIVRAVGDVGRPECPYAGRPNLEHIPGKEGPITGVTHLWGMVRHGRAHLEEQARRYGPIYRTQLGRYQVVAIVDPVLAGEILRNVIEGLQSNWLIGAPPLGRRHYAHGF